MSSVRPGRGSDQFPLRLPDGMRDRLKASAANLGRSMNSEIIQRLASSFDDDRSDVLKLPLPRDMWESLMTDALLHGRTEEEHANEILRGHFTEGDIFDSPSDYALALGKISKLTEDLADAGERYSHLHERMDYDFILYFNKVVQLDQFASLILAQSAQVVPAEVRAMADELRNVTQTEIAVLHERHKYAEYHKKRMEGALLNSPNADGIGKGIASVTYGETEEYTPSELATHWGVPEGFLSVLVTMDALSVRRTGAGKLDFMISKQMADRFAATKSGRNMLESMRSRAT